LNIRQAAGLSGITASEVGWFETEVCRGMEHLAIPLSAAYSRAGASWSWSSVCLTRGRAPDRAAIRAALALARRMPATLARDVARESGMIEGDIREALLLRRPPPSPEIVLACMEHLEGRLERGRCLFEPAPMGGWRKVSFIGGGGR